jgi:hypothetical protein
VDQDLNNENPVETTKVKVKEGRELTNNGLYAALPD